MYHYNLNLFGLDLRKIRKRLGLTLEGVSELSSISYDALNYVTIYPVRITEVKIMRRL